MRPEGARPAGPLLCLCALGAMAAVGAMTGCAGGFRRPPPATPAESRPEPVVAIKPALELMSSLPQGDPARQAEAFQAAKDAAETLPTTSNRLRYALALATPGHSGSDPVAAERQLSELLATPETLLPIERLLAVVELRDVEQQLVLLAENKRLRDEAAHDSHDKLQALNRHLTAEMDENARLRKALDEARAKLEAVTHIERSINDRDAGTPYKP